MGPEEEEAQPRDEEQARRRGHDDLDLGDMALPRAQLLELPGSGRG